jgi:hypothetical protein
MVDMDGQELVDLVRKVFRPMAEDRAMAVLVDLPDREVPDHEEWRQRRELALAWTQSLGGRTAELGLDVALFLYRNVRRANAPLPGMAWRHDCGRGLPLRAEEMDPAAGSTFDAVLRGHRIVLAPTEFSATAPLKTAARQMGFRAATMPGFTRAMIPALRVDYERVARRCERLRELLHGAVLARIDFAVDRPSGGTHRLVLDIRHRVPHASGGLVPEPGTAGNLPSGETYVAPYEGEIAGDPSRSSGTFPVQHGDEVVVYRVEGNRACEVLTEGPASRAEASHLSSEPAYGNLSELGLGVLSDLGVKPVGRVLLDEKLGLHLAFGRSDHLGGSVGPAAFSRPENAEHTDHVYVPEMQPRIHVGALDLLCGDGRVVALMRDGRYVVEFDG